MKTILLPGTSLRCSRFVFGTASLLNAGSARRRRCLLDAAVDHGFTHFDTAPLYGFGAAERDLAGPLRQHRHLTVTTKTGLLPPGGADQPTPFVIARKAAGKLVKALSRPIRSFDRGRAERSLDASLRRLGRDHVELFLLHEPAIEIVDVEDWVAWLDRRRAAGQIGAYGIAVHPDMLGGFLDGRGTALADVVQVLDSLDGHEGNPLLDAGRPLQLTYGYVSAARARGDKRDVADILAQALARNDQGAILVTTNRIERMAQYARVLEAAA